MIPVLLATLGLAQAAPPPAHPSVIVRTALGVPNLIGGQVEVFVADQWSVEVGGGIGLLPGALTLGGRFSPEATCWGCWEGHGARLSYGLTWYGFVQQLEEGLLSANVDFAWVWRSEAGPGLTAGARLGIGTAYGQTADGIKIEPGGELYPVMFGAVF